MSSNKSEFSKNVIVIMFLDIVKISIILIGIMVFIGNVARVPSGSMEPTLLVGDAVIVSRCSYGIGRGSFLVGRFQLPFPILKKRLFAFRKPQYGDVFAFRTTHKEIGKDGQRTYVKRLVGMPGDKIDIKNGYLYINDKKCEVVDTKKRYITERKDDKNPNLTMTVTSSQYKQTLPNGYEHIFIKSHGFGSGNAALGNYDNCGPFYVPEDSYFAMGDNRDDSTDSRSQEIIGFVKDCYIVGKVVLVIWSSNCRWFELHKLPYTIRTDRFFKRVR